MKTHYRLMLSLLVMAVAPLAQAGFRKEHPRRAEVNARVMNQRHRINEGVKNGTMTQEEAKAERKELRGIKREERQLVKANGGHLTQEQTKGLNQQLNQNSKEIYQEKHDGQNAAPAAAAPSGQ